MTERQTVDRSDSSAVVVCSCGWREVTVTVADGWRVAAEHGQRCHPGDNSPHARLQAWRYSR